MNLVSQLVLFIGVASAWAYYQHGSKPKHGTWDLEPLGIMQLITVMISVVVLALIYPLFLRWLAELLKPPQQLSYPVHNWLN